MCDFNVHEVLRYGKIDWSATVGSNGWFSSCPTILAPANLKTRRQFMRRSCDSADRINLSNCPICPIISLKDREHKMITESKTQADRRCN